MSSNTVKLPAVVSRSTQRISTPPSKKSSQSSSSNNNNTTHNSNPFTHVKIHDNKRKAVKHAGRVQVRGNILRVWRPRYLELDEDGILRYYEAAADDNRLIRKQKQRLQDNSKSSSSANTQAVRRQQHAAAMAAVADAAFVHKNNPNNNTRQYGTIETWRDERLHDLSNHDIDQQIVTEEEEEEEGTETAMIHEDENETTGIVISHQSYVTPTGEVAAQQNQQQDSMSLGTSSSTTSFGVVENNQSSDGTNQFMNNNLSQSKVKSNNNVQGKSDGMKNRKNTSDDNLHNNGGRASVRLGSWDHLTDSMALSSPGKKPNSSQIKMTKTVETPTTATLSQDDHSPPSPPSNYSSHHQNHQQQQPHHILHEHRPKARMAILSARTIDVATIRDMHIGLPKGRFGFVFRGMPLLSMDSTNKQHPSYNSSDAFGGNNNNQYSYDGSGGLGGYNYGNAGSVLVGEDGSCEISDELCSILAIEHDYFASSRNYLCSVATLEEAESWVVALRWAASVANSRSSSSRRQKRKNLGLLLTPSRGGGGDDDDDDDDENDQADDDDDDDTYEGQLNDVYADDDSYENDNDSSTMCLAFSQTKRKNNIFLDDMIVTAAIEDDNKRKNQSSSQYESDEVEGVIAVPKVANFLLKEKRRKRLFGTKCDFVYEVHTLMLPNSLLYKSTRRRNNNKKPSPNNSDIHEDGTTSRIEVQEQTIYRSFDEFVQLVKELIRSQNQQSDLSNLLTKFETTLKELQPKIISLGHPKSTTAVFNPLCTYRDLSSSVAPLDAMLRSLATDERLCNTTLIRAFLCLNPEESDDYSPSTNTNPPFHDVTKTAPRQETLVIQDNESTDTFVQQWLFGSQDKKEVIASKVGIKMMMALMLQHPLLEAFVSICFIFIVKLLVAMWYIHLAIHVTLRLDVILLSLFGIFYSGYMCGSWVVRKTNNNSSRKHGNQMTRTSQTKNHYESPEERTMSSVTSPQTRSRSMSRDTTSVDSNIIEEGVLDDDDGSSYAKHQTSLSSPLPLHPNNEGLSCWSQPKDDIFRVRGINYLQDRMKYPSAPSPFKCRGVDVWLTGNPERHIARHPSVLGGKLGEEDTFIVNFLLPFANFVAYFSIPPVSEMPKNVADVWTKFLAGDQQFRDGRLKLLPVVVDGPWIVKTAVGKAPAVLGQKIPLQYYFTHPKDGKKGTYEVDVIISASKIANGILNVVKGHTKNLIIAFAFIIEAAEESELPETVLCSFQIHYLHLECCPQLPRCHLKNTTEW